MSTLKDMRMSCAKNHVFATYSRRTKSWVLVNIASLGSSITREGNWEWHKPIEIRARVGCLYTNITGKHVSGRGKRPFPKKNVLLPLNFRSERAALIRYLANGEIIIWK